MIKKQFEMNLFGLMRVTRAVLPDFNNIKVYKHPDEYFEKENREGQKKMQSEKGISKRKVKRLQR